ncbi:MAG: zinc ribbon domain-containing protein [Gemmatimonadetes bacterium]|nr:zinc ribbon domain-containing protein [Gemmatimonadota bacterium]
MHHSSSTSCPQCGASVHGRFYESYGTAIAESACRQCGIVAPPGAMFCANCGTSFGGDAQPSAPDTPSVATPRGTRSWTIPAMLGVAAIAALGWAASRPSPTVTSGETTSPSGAVVSDGTPPDLSKLSPQEQFLRLSDRIRDVGAVRRHRHGRPILPDDGAGLHQSPDCRSQQRFALSSRLAACAGRSLPWCGRAGRHDRRQRGESSPGRLSPRTHRGLSGERRRRARGAARVPTTLRYRGRVEAPRVSGPPLSARRLPEDDADEVAGNGANG